MAETWQEELEIAEGRLADCGEKLMEAETELRVRQINSQMAEEWIARVRDRFGLDHIRELSGRAFKEVSDPYNDGYSIFRNDAEYWRGYKAAVVDAEKALVLGE